MKKVCCVLTLILLVLLFSSVASVAYAESEVSTDIFSPSSYLEFFDLNSPIKYLYDEDTDTHAVAEANRIIFYHDDIFTVKEVSGYNVTDIRIYKGSYILFISGGRLYYSDMNNWQIKDSGYNATYFDVYGDFIIASIGNDFYKYSLSVTDEGLAVAGKISIKEDKPYTAIVALNASEWLCVNEGALYRCTSDSSQQIAKDLGSVRYACYDDGYYYFSSDDGIGRVNVNTGVTKKLQGVATDSNWTLGNVYYPQGVTFINGKLYVTDSKLNAVSEFLIDSNNACTFTGFSISSRSDGAGRVSSQAVDLQTYKNTVYCLDGYSLKIFNEGNSSVINLPIEKNYNAFSVIENKLLLSYGTGLYLADLNKLTQASDLSIVSMDSNPVINAITSFENNFYFINNTIDSSSNNCVDVYKVSVENCEASETFHPEKVTRIMGTGYDICTDVFGKLYLLVYEKNCYKIIAFYDGEEVETTPIYSLSNDADKVLSIITDFECNVYALQKNNNVVRIDEDLSYQTYTLKLSDNFTKTESCKDLTIASATDDVYALFDGFILKVNPTDLNVSTPEKIKVPDDYENKLNDDVSVCKLASRARYFEISLDTTDGEYFDYVKYYTYDKNEEFVILHHGEKYSLIANDNLVCIVRNKDVTATKLNYAEESSVYYLTANGNLYTYPVLTPYFRCKTLSENSKVTVINLSTFNGVTFALVDSDGTKGYIPYTMLKTNVAINETPLEYQTMTVSFKGATVYLEEGLLTEIGTLSKFSTVKVYGISNGVYKIQYNGQIGYVKAEFLQSKGKTVVRNIILITTVLVAIIVTIIFAYRKKYLNKDE